jgi:hypothetical protein
MGQFSWFSQNTDEQIIEEGSRKEYGLPIQTILMIDDKDNRWIESCYKGYGVFGGKDFYELLAEMNSKKTRNEGIDLYFGNAPYLSPNLYVVEEGITIDDYKWIDEAPAHDPNQGWYDDDGDWEEDVNEWGLGCY